jgi:hypothetical protein
MKRMWIRQSRYGRKKIYNWQDYNEKNFCDLKIVNLSLNVR